MLAKLINH